MSWVGSAGRFSAPRFAPVSTAVLVGVAGEEGRRRRRAFHSPVDRHCRGYQRTSVCISFHKIIKAHPLTRCDFGARRRQEGVSDSLLPKANACTCEGGRCGWMCTYSTGVPVIFGFENHNVLAFNAPPCDIAGP